MRIARPMTLLVAGLISLVVSLGAAGSGEQARAASAIPANADDRVILHTLNRLGFGPRPGDLERVRRMGLGAYIEQQLDPERIPDTALGARLAPFETLTKSTPELAQEYFLPLMMLRRERQRQNSQTTAMTERDMRSPEHVAAMRAERAVLAELAQQKILRAAYSQRQLEEVLVDFWFNHFNVFAGKGPTRIYLTEYERDVIRPHVFGTFRDLLGATAHSPAMLFYLDNWQSAAPRPARDVPGQRMLNRRGAPQVPLQNRPVRGLNENYARELMELHTLGVDGGYTQKDVQEVARAFTGWTIDGPRQGGAFRFEPRIHDNGPKTVLGHPITAGGKQDGEQVLDILAAHPSTARFIATKLARRFVADDPPRMLVDRAAARFRATRGDIRDVVRTIVTSPEFFAAHAYRAKVKTPFEFVVSAVRATGTDLAGALPIVQSLRELGMPLYGCQPPTGYSDRADAWVNAGALLGRMNFAIALTSGRMRGVQRAAGSRPPSPASAELPPSPSPPSGGSSPHPTDALFASALAGDVSDSTRATVAKATSTPQAVALVLGSPEFQKR